MEWRGHYELPPKEVFFKLLDTRMDLIAENYAVPREQSWEEILQQAKPADQSSQCVELPPLRSRGKSAAQPVRRQVSYREVYDGKPPRRSSVRRQRPPCK